MRPYAVDCYDTELLCVVRMSTFTSVDRIELMQTFIRIVESGSLSAAAAQLGTTQPTVSRRLQALEQRLGLKLILRTTPCAETHR
ncbi:hypothetical protein E05_43260 [Plautia stali symbiont]|nr:hypothetical protein E05_43260 [Plautia stali symbiont]